MNSMKNLNIYNPIILFIVALLFVFCFSTTTSPLYSNYHYGYYCDSGIFQELGYCLVSGGTPYVDLFDHKGPILFFLQALGIIINPDWGISFLQILFLYGTLTIWYSISREFGMTTKNRFVVVFLTLVTLLGFYYRGNLSEEYSLPLISLPILFYVQHYRHNKPFSLIKFFVVGICVGSMLFIRANNTAPIVGFVLFMLYYDYQYWKSPMRLCKTLLSIIIGVAIVTAPCFVFYFIKAGWTGVYEMLYGTFLYNFVYIQTGRDIGWKETVLYYLPMVLFLCVSILSVKKENTKLTIPLIIGYIISILAIGTNKFYNYKEIFCPLFLITFCLVYTNVSRLIYFLLGIAVFQSFLPGSFAIDLVLTKVLGRYEIDQINVDFHRFISNMPEEERESIYNVWALPMQYFADEHIVQCNRIVLPSHLETDRLAKEEEKHGISEKRPQWVLISNDSYKLDDENLQYLMEHYQVQDSLRKSGDKVYCYYKISD